jgi:endonuclease III
MIRVLKRSYREDVPALTKIARRERNPFLVLIGCLLSLRTKDAVTDAAIERLLHRARTPQEILELPSDELEHIIYPVGFYRTKARVLKGVSRTLLDNYGGRVPNTMEELLKLKGVGRKTANIVITEAFGKPGIPVDTHVHRISNRLGAVRTKTPYETETELKKVVPRRYWLVYNMLLVTHGQKTCAPISPFCSRCPIFQLCGRVDVIKSR